MTEKPPYLNLVEPNASSEIDQEFVPLPYFPWSSRPAHLAIDIEEAATALYLAGGLIGQAAERLKIEPLKLTRIINRSPRLTRLHAELAALLNDRVHEEYVKAFASEDDRRREWASSKVGQSKQFQAHPLAPNAQSGQQLSMTAENANITFVWRTEPLPVEGKVIEGEHE